MVSYSFAYYVDKFANYANTYGGLGGIIILMLWFYLTGWVILLGGEINGLLHHYRTVTIIPVMKSELLFHNKRNRGYFMSNNKESQQ